MRRLESAHSPCTPINGWYESLDSFIEQLQAEIDAGRLCRFDGPILIACIRRWHREELWAGWRQTQNRWEYDGR